MCSEIADATELLVGQTYEQRKTGTVYDRCMAALQNYKPHTVDKAGAWYLLDTYGKRIRIATLNLCLTDVLHHGA